MFRERVPLLHPPAMLIPKPERERAIRSHGVARMAAGPLTGDGAARNGCGDSSQPTLKPAYRANWTLKFGIRNRSEVGDMHHSASPIVKRFFYTN